MDRRKGKLNSTRLIKRRPAETTAAGAGTLIGALILALGLTGPWAAVVIAAVGYLPALVTKIVEIPRVRAWLGYEDQPESVLTLTGPDVDN